MPRYVRRHLPVIKAVGGKRPTRRQRKAIARMTRAMTEPR